MDISETLESLIDTHGLLHVITAIDLICNEKAEHIRANWQDKTTAKAWLRASDAIYTASKKIESLGV